MLLYLTSNENLGLFDFLTDEKGMLVKKLSGEFSLNKFVIHDMRNLSHFSYVVIDLEALNDSEDNIVEAIKAFNAMYDSRIILFAEKADKALLDRLIKETETYNIITAKTIEKIKDEIRICVSSQGMSKDYLVKSLNVDLDISIEDQPKYSFIGENIKIIVAGAMNRVGTTTTAINMACYLANIGAKVSYTEANGNSHLIDIHSYYAPNIPIINNCFSYQQVNYFLNSSIPIDTDYNFNIIDIGTLNRNNVKVLEIGDIKILCGGNKPYEFKELKNSLELINTKDESLYILLPEGQVSDIKKKLPNQEQICTTKYSSNLFDRNINSSIWNLILSDYIVEYKTINPFNHNEDVEQAKENEDELEI